MGELPDGWCNTTIGNIASVSSGVGFPKRFQGIISEKYPVYKVGDVSFSFLNKNSKLNKAGNYVSLQTALEMKGKVFNVGSTLFAKIGEALKLNRRVIVKKEGLADNNVMGVKAYESNMDAFVFRFLQLYDIASLSRSTTIPSIRKGDVEEIVFSLPPLNEQIRIANKLDSLLAKVEAAQTRLTKIPILLKRFRQAVLAAATSGELTKEWRDENGNKWSVKKDEIGNLGNVMRGLTKNPKRSAFPLTKQYLRVANVYENELRLDDIHKIGVQKKELSKILLQKNDILVVEGNGSLDQIGRVAIWNNEVAECVHQNHLIKIRSKVEKIDSKFLLYYLMSPLGKEEIVARATSGAGLYTLSISKISSIQVPFVILAEQKEIVRRVESLFTLADTVEKQYQLAKQRTDKLTQSILAKAFKGELVPQDPNDEPAEQLLARIQAEREQRQPAKKMKKSNAK